VAFSYAFEPVLTGPRYGLLFILGWTPLVAYLAWRAQPPMASVLCITLVLLAQRGLVNARQWMPQNQAVDAQIKLIRAHTDADDIVVCTRRQDLYPIVNEDRALV